MNRETMLAPAMIAELLEMIHNALLVIDSNNMIIFTNSRTEKMFTTASDSLLGKSFTSLFMPDDADILVPNILSLTRSNGEIECEAMFLRSDGTTFLGRISGTRFEWVREQEGMVFSIHDISDMKEIEKSLKHSERVAFLGRLVDDISHHIRNPIVSIGGFARRLQCEHGASRDVEIILQEASRLEGLLDTLNKFANLPRPITQRYKLGDLAEELEEKIGARVRKLGCNWTCHCSDQLLEEELLLDKDLFFEAIVDVTENGCESYIQSYEKEERNIQCEIRPGTNDIYPITLAIKDFGIGIAAQDQELIFSHFYTDKTGHIGMGLTFARRIVEEQGGKMSIESQPNSGTTVTFHLIRERRRSLRTRRLPPT